MNGTNIHEIASMSSGLSKAAIRFGPATLVAWLIGFVLLGSLGLATAGAEPDRNLARGQVDDGRGNEERRDLPGPALDERAVIVFDRAKPADPGADAHAHVGRDGRRDRQPGIRHREVRRRDGVLDEDVLSLIHI